MSEYQVDFIESFIVQADSQEAAIQEAKNLFRINLANFDFSQGVEDMAVVCEIVPKLFKEKV